MFLKKKSDGTHVFSVFRSIISNLGSLLLQPFIICSICFIMSFFVMEQGIIGDQYFVTGC
jgi:hypothetical protein